MRKRLGLLAGSVWLCAGATAQEGALPPDPTQPDTRAERLAAALRRGPWRISLLLISPERTLAVINGQTFQPGMALGEGLIRSINSSGVTVELDGTPTLLRQNACFRIEELEGRRHLTQQETACQALESPRNTLPLHRDNEGEFWLEGELNDQHLIRFRLQPNARTSRIPATLALIAPTQGGPMEKRAEVKPERPHKSKPGERVQLQSLRLGSITLHAPALTWGRESYGVLGRDILDQLGAWRLDRPNAQLVWDEQG